jgi:hypothetical protein
MSLRPTPRSAAVPAVALSLLLAAACGPPLAPSENTVNDAPPAAPPPSGAPFLDVTRAVGIDFLHRVGDGRMDNIVESLGSGAVWFDADGDGDLDLYLVNQRWQEGVSTPPDPGEGSAGRLYTNRGNGTFEDATEEAGVGDDGYGYSAAAADIDGDGDLDLYVAACGANHLWLNRGDGTFTDGTRGAGVGDERCSAGATFFDLEGDGDLDLYVANYLTFDPGYTIHYQPDSYPGPLAYEAQPDALYRNRGDGTFEEVSAEAGITGTPGRAMGVVAADFDGDGATDVFVANDASENFLFHNDGAGRFTETAVESGVAFGVSGEATGAMAGVVGDLDGDALPDLLVTDTSYGSLYRATPEGIFEDWVLQSGLAAPSAQWVSWGGGFFDYDNDGDLDVLLVNGDLKQPTGRPDLLLANRGDGTFERADGGPYFLTEGLGRGGAFADYDDDGDLDVLVTHLDGAPVLLRNDLETGNHWVTFSLEARHGHWQALGARVTVEAGGRRWTQVQHTRAGYLTQSDPRLHFGLGPAERIDRVEVIWPGGGREELTDLAVDRFYRLVEGEGAK